jgi:hypothetical protein
MSAEDELIALIRRRIESRYRRICFVYEELQKLDAAAKAEARAKADATKKAAIPADAATSSAKQAKAAVAAKTSAASFEDFAFSHIDFSVYKKIDADEFTLLFDFGLDDYDDAFFTASFKMSRAETAALIKKAYIKAGPWFLCKNPKLLLLSVMRTLHTALTFAPLISKKDYDKVEELAAALDGVVIRHEDGMETALFVPKAETGSAGLSSGAGSSAEPMANAGKLRGTFHPFGKAHTIDLL